MRRLVIYYSQFVHTVFAILDEISIVQLWRKGGRVREARDLSYSPNEFFEIKIYFLQRMQVLKNIRFTRNDNWKVGFCATLLNISICTRSHTRRIIAILLIND